MAKKEEETLTRKKSFHQKFKEELKAQEGEETEKPNLCFRIISSCACTYILIVFLVFGTLGLLGLGLFFLITMPCLCLFRRSISKFKKAVVANFQEDEDEKEEGKKEISDDEPSAQKEPKEEPIPAVQAV